MSTSSPVDPRRRRCGIPMPPDAIVLAPGGGPREMVQSCKIASGSEKSDRSGHRPTVLSADKGRHRRKVFLPDHVNRRPNSAASNMVCAFCGSSSPASFSQRNHLSCLSGGNGIFSCVSLGPAILMSIEIRCARRMRANGSDRLVTRCRESLHPFRIPRTHRFQSGR